jgi:hypothetical protein
MCGAPAVAVAHGIVEGDGPCTIEQIARWNQQRGPRVGDCETKDGDLHRIGRVRGGRIRLASPSGRFSLVCEGMTYFGILINHPAQPERMVQRG